MTKEKTLEDIIVNVNKSIDEASPWEWHQASFSNYVGSPAIADEGLTISLSGLSQDGNTLSIEDIITNTDEEKLFDEVEKPAHYNHGKYETIDVIVDTLGKYEAISYCHGNVLKYVIRMWHKGSPDKDAKKARWYMDKMIQLLEETKGVNW